jgi:energy-coupling factor transport system permease protein
MPNAQAQRAFTNIHFSVATKFIVLLCAIVVAFTLVSFSATIAFSILLFILLRLQGYERTAWTYAGVFTVLLVLLYLNRAFGWEGIFFSEFYFYMIWRMIPVFMSLQIIMKTPPGEIVAALLKARIPNNITLMVVVAFRFAPTVASEMSAIREAMKCRGLLHAKVMLKNPVATLEYAIVPLILRSLNVADELSVSATVRGAEKPGQKSSYYKNELKRSDVLCIAAALSAVAVLFWLRGAL